MKVKMFLITLILCPFSNVYTMEADVWEYKVQPGHVDEAIELFEEAIKLDSNFADAYGYAAYAHETLYWYGYERNLKPLKIAKEYIAKGLDLDPDSPVLHATRGFYYYWVNRDYTRALEDFIYARDAVPSNAEYIANIGWIERRLGRFEYAIDNFLAGYKVDPKWIAILTSLVQTYDALDDRENAQKFLEEALITNPSAGIAHEMKIRWDFEDSMNTKEAKTSIENAKNNTDIKFLYYLLSVLNLNNFAGGSAQPLLTQGWLKPIKINLPPLLTQKKIAKIIMSH